MTQQIKQILDDMKDGNCPTKQAVEILEAYMLKVENALRMVSGEHKVLDDMCDLIHAPRFTEMIDAVESCLKD